MTIIDNTSKFTTYVGDTFQINFKLSGLQAKTTYNIIFSINSSTVIKYTKEITADDSGNAEISFFVTKDDTLKVNPGVYSLGLKLCIDKYRDTVYRQTIEFLSKVAGEICNE